MAHWQTDVPTTEGVWKFVYVNGQFRFTDSLTGCGHAGCVTEDELPTDAGTLFIIGESYFRIEFGSMTLGIGCSEAVEQELIKFMAPLPYRDKFAY